MKKLVLLLMCAGLLAACSSSSYSVQVSDADSVLVSDSTLKVTKQGFYEYLLDSYGANEVLVEALTKIADIELTDEDELNELVEEIKEEYASYTDDDLSVYASYMGYDDVDEYVDQIIVPSAKQELLRKHYITDNLDAMVEEYSVCSFKKIVVEKESEALNIISEATDEEAFDALMEEYSDDAEDAGMVTKNSTLDDNLVEIIDELSAVEQDGVYSSAIKLSDDTYAVLYLYDTDHSNTDDIIDTLSSDSDVQEYIEGIYLKKYNFDVYDSKIKAAIEEISDQYLD
ncbi:MAG: hypothetical protein LUH02_10140 [Erysipelotrichaceae bacterium]|nr:hypothetical protein [Erysipelotrichaceae bacterium]